MAENHPPTEPLTPTPGQAIPMGMKYHWWYDGKAGGAGVPNSPPANMTGHTASSYYSAMSQSPPAGGDMMGQVGGQRRDSLKNMVHLYDFATP